MSIGSNKRAGVKVSEKAFSVVLQNKIFGNFSQGILVTNDSSAHIELNEIFVNFKANIALGGLHSADTVVLNNTIYEGRAEGIFAIESGYAWIRGNTIKRNTDGIVLVDSSPHIVKNEISENMRAGVVSHGCSFPRLEVNKISGHGSAGVIVRNSSSPLMMGNDLADNYYGVSSD